MLGRVFRASLDEEHVHSVVSVQSQDGVQQSITVASIKPQALVQFFTACGATMPMSGKGDPQEGHDHAGRSAS